MDLFYQTFAHMDVAYLSNFGQFSLLYTALADMDVFYPTLYELDISYPTLAHMDVFCLI